jgi:hypothetical protein
MDFRKETIKTEGGKRLLDAETGTKDKIQKMTKGWGRLQGKDYCFFFFHWHYSPSGPRPTSMKLSVSLRFFFRILDSP